MALVVVVAFGVWATGAQSVCAAAPQITKVGASSVTGGSAVLKAEINPQGKKTSYRFEYGTVNCSLGPCSSIPIPEGKIEVGTSSISVQETAKSLDAATIYHFRVVAKNSEGGEASPDHIFATSSSPFSGLPDGRAYEQASPVNKNGGDVVGDVPTVKAFAGGGGITFASTFGIPGGKGAQELPSYLTSRGAGGSGWSTQGLLPPPEVGERAQVVGWSPDYTEVFSDVTHLASPKVSALVVQSSAGGSPVQITAYVAGADYSYVGSSEDGSVVLFESRVRLPAKEGQSPIAAALNGAPNLYVWDRATGEVGLAGVLNDKAPPPKGAIAGPYEWTEGINSQSLRLGGSLRGFYLQDEHAVAPDGSVYFTEAGTGQLYRRLNPTQEQSALSGGTKGKCTEPAKACTVRISASHKTDGKGPNGIDSAGPQPAAFQAASADGSQAFFTSPEKLTNNANTGSEQPPAQIELGGVGGGIERPDFILTHAVGVAADGSHVYWADPGAGAIGRANLDGSEPDPGFIEPGPVEFEFEEEVKPGVFETKVESVESEPRYVAVDAGHVYWTNTGRRDEFGPIDGEGTIGRANIEAAAPTEIEPAFIEGASNPQGIAVNEGHIYWANAARDPNKRAIGRSGIEGAGIEQKFVEAPFSRVPYGVALSASSVYYGLNEEELDIGFLGRVPLEGGKEESLFVGKAGVRGVGVDASHVYWATQGEEAIGRSSIDLEGLETKFVKLAGKPNGLAVNAEHLYWSTNGEAPTNPGNDLYRYEPRRR